MSSSTRVAASFFSGVSRPIICVRTGPFAGKVSMMVSDWKRTTASVIIGWNTPQAPSQGSVLSSNFKPNKTIPSLYIFSQSEREPMSLSISSDKSLARLSKTPPSKTSAKFSSKSMSSSSPFSIDSISSPSILTFSASGSSTSISISGSSFSKPASPCGAAYKLFSMLIFGPSNMPHVCGICKLNLLVRQIPTK